MSLLFLKFKQSILNEFFPVYTQVTDVLIITKKYKTEQCKFYIYENCRQLYKNEGVFFFPLFDFISLLLLSYTVLYFTMCIFNIYIKMSFLWQVLGTRREWGRRLEKRQKIFKMGNLQLWGQKYGKYFNLKVTKKLSTIA